uniref:WAP four-disulfide core domain 2 n=1 Tax=Amphilophus citrinellus TaxID=61819 RepID=A0A3Q0SVQ8_AMPCI
NCNFWIICKNYHSIDLMSPDLEFCIGPTYLTNFFFFKFKPLFYQLIHILACFNASFSVMLPKPVSCPWQPNLALSRKRCEACPRDHICCVCDGEDVCVPPVFKKPGVCPRRRLVFGHCMKSCSYDGDCPNNNKCCSTGCGRDCMAPVIAKPGFCPQRRMCFGHCSESCSYDSDCPDNEKCCSNGCGHVCMAPAVD